MLCNNAETLLITNMLHCIIIILDYIIIHIENNIYEITNLFSNLLTL